MRVRSLRGNRPADTHCQLWYVLQDHASGRFHRFTPAAHLLISLMDGTHTVHRIWEIAAGRLGDDLPTQDEVINLLAQLHGADVLVGDVPPDVDELSRRSDKQRRAKLLQSIRNPLAVRLPLIDPDRFLTATMPFVRIVISPGGFLAWLAIVLTAAVLAGVHWAELTENITDRVLAADGLLRVALVYPLIKAVHELGHGYAAKRWGGEVHEMGILMLVLVPVPYVDASAASAFREKRRRALVSAAGIMVEMLIAALALFVWLNAEPGALRATAYSVMLVAGVSTVLFNGNPLLRFDGYYVLADLIEIPNLASQANRYLGYLTQRHLFGVRDIESPVSARGESAWFVFYGVTAFVYRLFIMVAIILFVATKFFIIGVLLALWAVIIMYGVPLAKLMSFLFRSPVLQRRRPRALAISGAAVAAAVAALVLVPVPHGTVAEGIVWVPDQAMVHAGSAGLVTDVLAEPNSMVARGTPLVAFDEPLHAAQVRTSAARLRELQLTYAALDIADLVQAAIVDERIQHAEAELALAEKRLADLVVNSPTAGRFIIPSAADLPGRFVRKGQLLAYVVAPADPVIRVIVPQSKIDLVRGAGRRVEVRFVDRVMAPIGAVVTREVPGATNSLPSRALSTAGGGGVAIDPADPNQNRALSTLFQLELQLTEPIPVPTIGGRVLVRFDHGNQALAGRLYRTLRQVFLSRFGV